MGRGTSTDREKERGRWKLGMCGRRGGDGGMGMVSWRERCGQRNEQDGHQNNERQLRLCAPPSLEAVVGRLCGVGSRGYCCSAESGQGLRGPGGGAGDGAALPTNTELSECSDTRWLVQVYRLNTSSEQGEGPPRLMPGWSWWNLSMFWGALHSLLPLACS